MAILLRAFDKICTSITANTVQGALSEVVEAQNAGADLVELRLDCIEGFRPDRDLAVLMKGCTLPYIVTFRPEWEG